MTTGGQTERWGHLPPAGQGDDRGMSQPRTIPQVLDRIANQFADHDALVTEDRRLTFAQLRDEVRRAAVAMIDLVGLKTINDTHGHIAGDAALRLMAEAIRTGIRADDRGYRVGGDEFALILPNTVLADPTGLIERLRRAGAPECTIGVASLPGDPRDRLVELADSRLYDARDTHAKR